MKLARIYSLTEGSRGDMTLTMRYRCIMTSQRKLLVAWLLIGMFPFVLQTRSYLKFATPHKITENLLVPPRAEPKTDNLAEKCPMKGFHVGQVWWNVDVTHYHALEHYHLCHYVVPQYNSHGNYLIGSAKVEPFVATPESCTNDSFPIELFFYHGSIGYFSYYDELVGTYCARDYTSYTRVAGLGTFGINGAALAKDPGSDRYRWSLWYSIVGAIWLTFRGLVLRRSYISCKRYGEKCDEMDVNLRRKAATIFVHENLRLSAHGASNYQRVVLLYFLLEGLMSDLFLLAATDGSLVWLQYVSLGYNLSGILLLIFEIVETMRWISEKSRLFIKRVLFSYESSLLGELLSALGLSYVLTGLNHSDLKRSKPIALEISYYMWGLVGHSVIVATLIGSIAVVRIICAATYVRWKHGRTWDIFSAPCCVDTTVGVRSKMTKLAGYHWEDGKLYYRADSMKSFGLLKMDEEDGTEFLVLRKLHWFKVHQEDLLVIGSVSERCVEPCSERPCTGVVSFFNRNLGGTVENAGSPHSQAIRVGNKVSPSLSSLNVLPSCN
ncbi:hypothetical protein PHYPSEUDO_002637 [Phytophthora pseudosyringae]|uniref:Transmembrane protein n=1 Tax=Phytophthora pseudosyringae TaxID=221518 RepID=A0A8T1VTV9_9STRA|nr:hypothetical protein PHYPSEUDO_002637 [Phytophthora pseudosyringae]